MWDVTMRGDEVRTEHLFSYLRCEARVPRDHPLRPIRTLVDQALRILSPAFDQIYGDIGRPSIPPEKLLRALLLQALYSVRSERQLMEQLDYHLLFRWFVGLARDAAIWDVTVFTKNRARLLEGDSAAKFFQAVLGQPRVKALLADDHFSVDGTLIEAFASIKSFKPKAEAGGAPPAGGGGRNRERDFHGQKRANATHVSTTDPDARLFRKGRGKEAKLCPMGHLLMENRHGLIVDTLVSQATGTAERDADKAYAPAEFVADLRALNVTPHVAQNTTARRSASDARPTRHPGSAVSQRVRKRIEVAFSWIKTTGGLRKTRHRGVERVGWLFTLTAAACNLVRLPELLQGAEHARILPRAPRCGRRRGPERLEAPRRCLILHRRRRERGVATPKLPQPARVIEPAPGGRDQSAPPLGDSRRSRSGDGVSRLSGSRKRSCSPAKRLV
jgi:transposase